MSPKRIDVALVERGLFPSRAKAREAIEAGLVAVDGKAIAKPSELVAPEAQITAQAPYPWVSRGGVKLAAALDAFAINVSGAACLDIGASTGGFTDVLLTRGAASVVCVDVGTAQLHDKLRSDPRVSVLENTDARRLSAEQVGAPWVLVADVSFISIRKVLPPVLTLMAPLAVAVVLVKPQFEVGPAFVKKGVVRSERARIDALIGARKMFLEAGWSILGAMPSPITGGDGNVEYLVAAVNGKVE